MKRKKGILIILLVLVLGGLAIKTGRISLGPFKKTTISPTEETPTPESPQCTLYTNVEFGFSLCYPANWALPEEERITPPQQQLYHMVLNPDGEDRYFIDIYDQPSPIPLRSFIENYFKDFEGGPSEISETIIGGNEAVKFVIMTGSMTSSTGIPHIAFRKGAYVLVLSRTAIRGEPDTILTDGTLNRLTKSFKWVE